VAASGGAEAVQHPNQQQSLHRSSTRPTAYICLAWPSLSQTTLSAATLLVVASSGSMAMANYFASSIPAVAVVSPLPIHHAGDGEEAPIPCCLDDFAAPAATLFEAAMGAAAGSDRRCGPVWWDPPVL
jgi:hypothetical protein